MSNKLQYESSPYLLQHKDNPVDWFPWCEEAFSRAKEEDKPVFLSIGYSTCHWCHVMAHESFEDKEIAQILNKYFISIKVDKEERPDIDSIYMSACQAFTGSGGWPTSLFLTAEQKPFFAGTYFPKESQGGMVGFKDLLHAVHSAWENNRKELLSQSDSVTRHLNRTNHSDTGYDTDLIGTAVASLKHMYDEKYGGFGRAPKFPTPHNILFLLTYYQRHKDSRCLQMAEHTLLQMYKGGMFDHIGFGFCRYSTDKKFLVPHFEKMLYDNALLILAYCKAFEITRNNLYLEVAEKTATFVLKEMTSPEGGFYSALDADSDGQEGKFYVFTPDEIINILGNEGKNFNRHYDITENGNFEGKSIPNLSKSAFTDKAFEKFLPLIESYRKKRCSLHLDDKILTSWNSLMIGALCRLYLLSKKDIYLNTARNADNFICAKLCKDNKLFVSYRNGKQGVDGFLDDYAGYIFSQLELYRATAETNFLYKAEAFYKTVKDNFSAQWGGFYLYGKNSEALITRPQECYDGAMPSGNSLIAYNLVRLSLLLPHKSYGDEAKAQLDFLKTQASAYPAGYTMFLTALAEYSERPKTVVAVPSEDVQIKDILFNLKTDDIVTILKNPTNNYPLKNNKTTFYVCENHICLPPSNDLKISS